MGVDLTKRAEVAQDSIVSLLKESQAKTGVDPGVVEAQVVLAIDYSSSMSWLYTRGVVQDLAERGVALSIAGLDDDGNIQIVMFHHDAFDPFTVDGTNYQGVIKLWMDGGDPNSTAAPAPVVSTPQVPAAAAPPKKKWFGRRNSTPPTAVSTGGPQKRSMGGTDYLPAINRVVRMVKEDLDPSLPTLVLFFTDGATGNQPAIKRRLVELSGDPIYWQFCGLGYTPTFIKELDTMGGRKADNVGLFEIPADASSMPDDVFFEKVTHDYIVKWTPEARAKGIIK